MKDSDPDRPDSRYVIGTAPVNRRTVDPHWLEQQTPAPAHLVERARQLRQRHELGAPLAELVSHGATHAARAAVPGTAVGGLIAGTALLPLAAFSGSLWLGLALGGAAALLLGYAGWRITAARRAALPAGWAAGRAPLVAAQALEALDRVMASVAPELDDALLDQLMRLKHTLVRVIELDRAAEATAFSSEDQLYLQQCIKRYLPDSLLAYLNVPATHRHRSLAHDGSTPAQALAKQLALIQQDLDQREQHAVAAASEALLRQQRFLQAKTRQPR